MKIQTSIQNLNRHRQYTKMKELIHEFLQKEFYTQIDVPVLSPILIPESYLEVFETEFTYMDKKKKLYLTPSPELFLKRLMVSGLGSCYALTKAFRNSEPHTSRHSPEFTILEFYKVNSDYMDLATDVINLFRHIAQNLLKTDSIMFRGKTIELDKWEKITVSEAFKKYAGIDSVLDNKEFFVQAKQKGYIVEGFSYADVWSQIYTQEIEPHLGKNGRPTMIYEYPKELAATAQFNAEKNIAERLEVYIEGIELGNCGNAATQAADWDDFERRFKEEDTIRKKTGKIQHPPDAEFVSVLKQLPQCAGIAIGVERLAMIFTDAQSIEELQLIHLE